MGAKQNTLEVKMPGLLILLAAQLSVLVGDVDVELQSNTRAVKHVGPSHGHCQHTRAGNRPSGKHCASTACHSDRTQS